MNVFFDVDYTLISDYDTLRPWVRETFEQLTLDGHTIYVWSGVGIRWPVVKRFGLTPYVKNCFQKPLDRHLERLPALKVDVMPDFCIDDYQEIIDVFGGAVIKPYYWPDPLDLEMHRIYSAISAFTKPAVQPEAVRTLPPAGPQPLTYVALGDSTVFGTGATAEDRTYPARVHAMLRGRYPAARLLNLGKPGATALDVLKEQVASAIGLQPQLITLSVGPNDLTGGAAPAEYAGAMEDVLRRLVRETGAVVVLTLLPDLSLAGRFTEEERMPLRERVLQFNQALQNLAAQYRVTLVDLYSPSRDLAPHHPEWLSEDGYHPSDEGYAHWAAAVWQRILTRIP